MPRDADLKSLLKTQRVGFLESVEDTPSNAMEGANHDHKSSDKLRLDGAQAIRIKLEEIEDITKSLSFTTNETSQSKSDVGKLKVRE